MPWSLIKNISQTDSECVAGTSGINAGNDSDEDVQPMDVTVYSPNLGLDGMVIDPEDRSKSPSIPLPNPIEEPSLPSPPPPPPPPPYPLTQAGRPKRNYRQPARYIDLNPEPCQPLEEEPPPPTSILPRVILIVRNRLRTAANSFNLFREYLYRPSFDPDSFVPSEDLLQVNDHERMNTSPTSPQTPPLVHRNKSVEMLMNWKDSGSSTKSDGEINRLVDEVLLDPNFNLEELRGFRAARENRRTDKADENSPFSDSFQTATVEIEVPSGSKEVPPAKFSIPGLRYRKITAVIRAMFASPLAPKYHLSYSARLQVAKKNVSFARSMTRMPTLRRTTKSSAHQCHLMIQIANVRRQWQQLCYGQMPHTWQTSEQPNSGPFTCSLEIFRSTFALYQIQVPANILRTSPLFPILSKTSQPNFIRNGEHKRRIS